MIFPVGDGDDDADDDADDEDEEMMVMGMYKGDEEEENDDLQKRTSVMYIVAPCEPLGWSGSAAILEGSLAPSSPLSFVALC